VFAVGLAIGVAYLSVQVVAIALAFGGMVVAMTRYRQNR
jgi:hypothetical protein